MKNFQSKIEILAMAAVLIHLTACGGQDFPQKLVTPTREIVGPEDSWKLIKTFGQSIETASFGYDASARVAKLGVLYRDIDSKGNDGVPVFSHVSNMTGAVREDGTATLADARFPDVIAQLKCESSDCLIVDIEVTKSSGTIAGRAKIRQTTLKGTNIYTGISVREYDDHNMGDSEAVEALNSGHPRSVNLTVTEIDSGRKNSFSLTIQLLNHLMLPQDEGYFDSKEVTLEGETGEDVVVVLSHNSVTGSFAVGSSSPYRADVRYNAQRAVINATFDENLSMKQPDSLLFIRAGRELFSATEE